MKTDIERLHAVVEGQLDYHGCGKTYAKCHEVAGLLEVIDVPRIICKTNSYIDFFEIVPMLTEVLREHDLHLTTIGHDIVVGDAFIMFVPEFVWEEKTKDYDNFAMVDFT